MNRTILIMVFLCVFSLAFNLTSLYGVETSLKGDTNGDETIDGRDALLVLQQLEGLVALSADQIQRADVYPNPGTENRRVGDGILTREDAETILEETVGLIPRGDLTGDYSGSEPVIDAIEPLSGSIGDTVVLMGRNFPAGGSAETEVYLGNVRAEIVSITGSLISIKIPEGAASGRIRLYALGGSTVSHETFSVLNRITGVLNVSGALDSQNFLVFSVHDFVEIDNPQGTFVLDGPTDELVIYQAATVNDDNPNVYLYYWIPGYSPLDSPIQIDAFSTAKAMVFTHPLIASKDEVLAAELYDLMDLITEVEDLAEVIAQRFPLGVDGVEDPEIGTAWQAAVDALLAVMRAAPSAKPVERAKRTTATLPAPSALPFEIDSADAEVDFPEVKIYGIDRNYLSYKYRKEDRSIVMKLDNGYSPVDWFVTMYKLDPDRFPRGINVPFFEIQTAGFKDCLHKSSMMVSGNLWTAKIDILYYFTDWGTNILLDTTGVEGLVETVLFSDKYDSLKLQEPFGPDAEGFYLIHGYSGGLYTPLVHERKDFTAIRAIQDGTFKMGWTLSANAAQIGIDLWDLLTGESKRMTRAFFKKGIKNSFRRVSQDLARLDPIQNTTLELGAKVVWGVIVEGIKAGITTLPQYYVTSKQKQLSEQAKTALAKAQGKARDAALDRLQAIGTANAILGFLDKLSSGGRIAERFLGLLGRLINVYEFELSPGPSPLESAIVVVGDPFSPKIASISPLEGPSGIEVTIEGQRFAPDAEDNTVWFGSTQAEVVAVQGRERLIVRVPQPNVNFAYYKNYTVKVETPAMMKAAQSVAQFKLRRLPTIASLVPNRIFSSVPTDDTGPFAYYQSQFAIVGAGFKTTVAIWDNVFVDDREATDLNFAYDGSQILVSLPPGIQPGTHEVYIVSPENNDYTTPRFSLETIGPPIATRLEPARARVGQNVTVKGSNFLAYAYDGSKCVPVVGIGDSYAYEVTNVTETELTFRMPTVGAVGDTLPVRVYTPSGISGELSITREAGLDFTMTSLPEGFWMEVKSPSSGTNADGLLSVDEAAAIARGAINPFAKPWDDENEEWTHYFHQIKRLNDDGSPYYIWVEYEDEITKKYSPGGPGNEYRKHFRVDRYHPDNGGTVTTPRQTSTDNLDGNAADKEEGDYVAGASGGVEYADKIYVSSGETVFGAVDCVLGNHDTLEFADSSVTLNLGGRGLQIPYGCLVYLPDVICEIGDAITITGSHNYVAGKIVGCGQNGVVVKEGIGNKINMSVSGCKGNGIWVMGGGANGISDMSYAYGRLPKSISAEKDGVRIENSIQNEIGRMAILECGGNGIYVKDSSQNSIENCHINGNQGDGVVLDNSAYNTIRNNSCAGNRNGLVLFGAATYENRIERVAVGAVYKSIESSLHISQFSSFLKNRNFGIHLYDGANTNVVLEAHVYETGNDGILIEGNGTKHNIINNCTVGDVGNPDRIPAETVWPPKSPANGLVLRNGASENSFYSNGIYRQVGHGILVEGPGTNSNRIMSTRLGNTNDYGNGGWGAVVKAGPQSTTFDIAYAISNGLGGYLVDGNNVDWPLGASNTVFKFCEAEGPLVGMGFELFSSSNVFLDRCKTKGYDCGLWIHGPNSQNNDVWSGTYRNGARAGILVEGSTGDRISNTAYQQCPLVAFHVKDSSNILLEQLRYVFGGGDSDGVVLRVENSQAIDVMECNFYQKTIVNTIEILNSRDVTVFEGGVQEAVRDGIRIAQGSQNIVLHGCDVSMCGYNGINILESQDITIDGVTSASNKLDGVQIENGRNVVLQGVTLIDNKNHGLHVFGDRTDSVTVTGSEIGWNVDGIHADAGTGLTFGKASSREEDLNFIASNENAGVLLSGVNTQAVVIGNAIGVGKYAYGSSEEYGNKNGIVLQGNISGVTIQSNRIVWSTEKGILLHDSARDNTITRNEITNNSSHGVLVQGEGTVRNVISMNAITGNGGKGIALENGGNRMQPSPTIERVTWQGENIWGSVSAPNGSAVEIYFDSDDEGQYMAGMGKVSYNRFHVAGGYDPTMNLHGVVIAPDGNTSEFGPVALQPERADCFVFTGERDGNRDIYYMAKSLATPLRLTRHTAADDSPHALADGSGVLFVSDRQGNPDIWLYRTAQQDEIQLTESSFAEFDPCLEPGGNFMVYVSNESGKSNVYRVSFSGNQTLGTTPVRLTDNASENRHPVVSPNGNEIAFSSNQSGTWDIWVMNRDGSSPRKLTDGVGTNTDPVWSKDGQTIVFVSDRNGQADLYQIQREGTGLMRLTQNTGFDGDPAWSLDGKRLIFSSTRDAGLEIYGTEAGELQIDRLTHFAGSASQPHAAPLIASLLNAARSAVAKAAQVESGARLNLMDIELTARPEIVKPGEEVAVAIHATQASQLANVMFECIYDPAVLRLLGAESTATIMDRALAAQNPTIFPSEKGWLRWNWAQPYGFVGDAVLMNVRFEVNASADETETQVNLAPVQAFNADSLAIDFNHSGVTIEIDMGNTPVSNWMIFE